MLYFRETCRGYYATYLWLSLELFRYAFRICLEVILLYYRKIYMVIVLYFMDISEVTLRYLKEIDIWVQGYFSRYSAISSGDLPPILKTWLLCNTHTLKIRETRSPRVSLLSRAGASFPITHRALCEREGYFRFLR